MSVAPVTLAYLFGTAPLAEVAATSTCEAPCRPPTLTGSSADIALVAANGFVFVGFSRGPVAWGLLGARFPNRIRAIALSAAASAQSLATFVVSSAFPPLAAHGLGLADGLCAFLAIGLAVLGLDGRAADPGSLAGADGAHSGVPAPV